MAGLLELIINAVISVSNRAFVAFLGLAIMADVLGAALARVVAGRSLITSDNEDYEPPEGAVSSSLLDAPRRVGGRGIDAIRAWITNVKGTVTPRDNFAGRSHGRYGVGEIIDLAHQGPNNAAYYGGLLEDRLGRRHDRRPTDGTALYTSPRKPGVVNLERSRS